MNTSFRNLMGLLTALVCASAALADRVELTDGSVINGKIIAVEGAKLKVDTAFAGAIEIAQSSVKSFSTDEAVHVGLAAGSEVLGKVVATDAGIRVEAVDGRMSAATEQVVAVWRPGADSPTVRAAKEAAEKAQRKWAYEASVAITGRTGPSEKFNAAFGFKATLAGDHDKLIFSLAAEQAEDNGVKTADRQFGGVDYSSFFSADNGWYARTSLEKDEIKDIELRSLSAFGFGRKIIKKDHQDLEFRLGFSYLHETYVSGGNFESPGLDLTVLHSYQFKIAKLNSVLTYTPAFEDFANYRVTHESSLELPLTASLWKLKLGLSNQYQSKPPGAIDKLDTTYFTSLILNWQ